MAKKSKWNKRFIDLAFKVASWSKDPSCRVGAVVVSKDKLHFALGYNGLPRKVEDSEERLQISGKKLKLTVHAEVNAILNAPVRPDGWSLYATRMPCLCCALAIVQSGITKVYCPLIDTSSKWAQSQQEALALFKETGIKVVWLNKGELQHELI